MPAPPAEFREQCAAASEDCDPGPLLRALAGYGLNEHQLRRLAGAIAAARARHDVLHTLEPLRLGIVGDVTVDLMPPALTATAARHGLLLECVCAPFGQALQQATNPASEIRISKPDAVLLAFEPGALGLVESDDAKAAAVVEAALARVSAICARFVDVGITPLVETLPPPPQTLLGSLDAALAGSARRLVDAYNREICSRAAAGELRIVDVAQIASTVGLADWRDPTAWHLAKVPFHSRWLPLWSEHICRVLGAMRGKSRRCLVLDLDNTLWGGTIGDDGLSGITLGAGDPTGEAFIDVQRTVLELRRRGIVLAVSSKNDDAIAREPFRSHPDMLLREEHVAVFQANWDDKPSNIRAIANRLELGLEFVVFMDDNPVERELVRRTLPQVAVPELPDDPALFTTTLLAAGYFEAVAFSAEDAHRADAYRGNAERLALGSKIADVDAYLRSLSMTLRLAPFDPMSRARIAQLVNKSNQFNLTTQRYTEVDIAAMVTDRTIFTMQARLEDRFGDNGMISVVICRRVDDAWHLDTWLMSCRVLGREVERAILDRLLRHARSHAVSRLIGTYVPTARNALVAGHYQRLGFSPAGNDADGTTRWTLDVSAYEVPVGAPLPMHIEERGFATDC